ncbi:HAD-IA family hydrolase [Halodesulfovibrio aestuarii]|uniref:HAD-IA family hydrolase n=1 Tax=Halodesulfovibrio aestuarii TaxID=126333 RepID=A0ABV4JUU7_9BACT
MHTLVFDVYGTLVDTAGVVTLLEGRLGERAGCFAKQWRSKQLEYSFRMGLMRWYQPFSQCMRYAFEHTCEEFHVSFSSEEKEALFLRNLSLPAFPDAEKAMPKFAQTDAECFAFSNGTAEDVETVLVFANLRQYLQEVVSVDTIKMYKPSRIAYMYLLERLAQHSGDGVEAGTAGGLERKQQSGSPQGTTLKMAGHRCLHYIEAGLDEAERQQPVDAFSVSSPDLNRVWLISSNPFDVIGAKVAGLHAVWVRRSASSVYDPWGIQPTITVANLIELYDVLLFQNVIALK